MQILIYVRDRNQKLELAEKIAVLHESNIKRALEVAAFDNTLGAKYIWKVRGGV